MGIKKKSNVRLTTATVISAYHGWRVDSAPLYMHPVMRDHNFSPTFPMSRGNERGGEPFPQCLTSCISYSYIAHRSRVQRLSLGHVDS